MQKNIMTVAFLQNAIELGYPANTAKHLTNLLNSIHKTPTDIIMLPEIFLGGPVNKKEMPDYAILYTEFVAKLKVRANDHNTCFYGSIIELRNGFFFNTAIFVTPEKNVQNYRKNHLFRFDGEHRLFSPGKTTPLFKTSWGKAAPLVCYDIRFPELMRKMTFRGARFALVCAQWPESRRDHWLTLLRARAIENQIYIIACNRTGTKNTLTYSGDSCVISPWGDFAHLQKSTRKSAFCTIDLALVEAIRSRYPFLQDAKQNRNRFDI